MAAPMIEKYLPIDPDDRVVVAVPHRQVSNTFTVFTANGRVLDLWLDGQDGKWCVLRRGIVEIPGRDQ